MSDIIGRAVSHMWHTPGEKAMVDKLAAELKAARAENERLKAAMAVMW